jgi:hypothetical protein
MFAGSELAKLEETKRLLAAQAEIHRSVLRLEAARWSGRVAQLKSIQQSFSAYRGILMAVAAGAGLLAAKRGSSIFRWFPIALSLWRTLRNYLR